MIGDGCFGRYARQDKASGEEVHGTIAPAVARIAKDGAAQMRHMGAQLVRATSARREFDGGQGASTSQNPPFCMCALALGVHDDPPALRARADLEERGLADAAVAWWGRDKDGPISLLCQAIGEEFVQGGDSRFGAPQSEAAGRIRIKPMGWLRQMPLALLQEWQRVFKA